MKRLYIMAVAVAALALAARAELVHVYQQTVAGAATNLLSDTILETGASYATQSASAIDGYIFTHWSISTSQEYMNRDRWGRALDAAPYTLYEETTLTANYLPTSQDTDADGVADGHELYWYGGLQHMASSDTDNDGFTFAEELALGANPLFADEYPPGGIECADSELLLYNPLGYQPYILRSEPEGALFASSTNWVVPGSVVTTPSYDHESTIFAYWSMNGSRQDDRWGRALDSVSFTMPSNSVEVVAYTATDDFARQALYWYGCPAESAPSDSDNDGFTFSEELALGTNPLFADEYPTGGIEYADSDLLLYNPYSIQPYILRSEPDGALFASSTNWVRAGTTVSTETFSPTSSAFAYWTSGGAEQRDRWGRALDSLSFAMPTNELEVVAHTENDDFARQSLYWYGRADMAADSDTDGDGFTFSEELALGTNPLFTDEYPPGGIEYADSELLEANLQPYEQLTHGLVGGEAVEIFRSNWERNPGAMNFGTNAAVAVVDANGDGLADLLVAGAGEGGTLHTTLLLNGGAEGSPDFAIGADPWPTLTAALSAGCVLAGGLGPDGLNGVYLSGDPIRFFDFTMGAFIEMPLSGIPAWHDGILYALDPETGTICTTNGVLSLDTPVISGISLAVEDVDHDGLADLLVTDVDGRVWFYRNNGDGTYTLQHKIWGGSFGGFAEGLHIATIDWNADGNLDAVGATAGGTLVLLRDPNVGIPANLRLAAGLTSVVLDWDPNTQSRVRGYRVYRAEDLEGDFAQLTTPWTPLPTYRDYPETLRDWWYRVTSVGRFYTTGNSTPTFIESAPTEALVAHLGSIELFVRDANGITGQEVEISVAINNSLGMAAQNLSFTLEYDATLLEARRVIPSGLTEAVQFTQTAANGGWRIAATGGTVDPGAGTLFTLVFYVKPQHVADETTLAITAATAKSVSGQTATIPLPVRGTLSIFDSDPPVKPNVAAETCVTNVMERETVALPVVLATDRTLDRAAVRIDGSWDTNRLEFVRIDAETGYAGSGSLGEFAPPDWRITGAAGIVPAGTNTLATLVFRALDVESDMRTVLPVTNVVAVSTAGVAVSATLPDPFVVRILNNPSFDPVHATFLPGTASAKIGTEAALPVSVQIDAPLDGAAWSISGTYDAALLDVLGATAAPGTTNLCVAASGVFTVRGTGGTLAAAAEAQPLFALRVKPKVQYAARTAAVTFADAAATATDDRVFETAIGAGGDVSIRFASATDGPVVTLDAFAGEVVERETISVPMRFSTTEALDLGEFAVDGTWDTGRLELVRMDGMQNAECTMHNEGGTWRIEGTAGVVPEGAATAGTLVFRAKDVAATTNTLVYVTGGTAVSTEGIAGEVPEGSYAILVRNNIAFDPAHATFMAGSSATKVGTATTLPVSALVDAPLNGSQWSISGTFDTSLLDVTGADAAAGLSVSFSRRGNTFTVRGTGGALAAGATAQPLFTLNVTAKTQYATRLANIALRNPTAQTTDGRTFTASVAAGGDIALRFSSTDDPPIVSIASEDRTVTERERVSVPVAIAATDAIDLSTLLISGTWDADRLTFVEATVGNVGCAVSASGGRWTIRGNGGILPDTATLANFVFEALDVERDVDTFVSVTNASVRSAEALDASIVPQKPQFRVRILNNPSFDPVHATFLPGTASAKIGTEAALPVSVQIDAPLDGAAWSISGTYDAALLDVLGATAAPGTTNLCVAANGVFTVRGTGGTLAAAAGAQALFALRVKPKVQYAARTASVTFADAAATAADGRVFETAIGAGGDVSIRFASATDGPVVTLDAFAGEVVERETISVPVRFSTTEALDLGEFAVEGTWDTGGLELVRMDGMQNAECTVHNDGGTWRIEGTAGVVPEGAATAGTLVFRAKDVAATTNTLVYVTGGTAVSTEGIAGEVPEGSYAILVRNNIAFDPAHATFMAGSSATKVGTATTLPISALVDAPLDGSQWSVSGTFDTSLLDVTGANAAGGLSVSFSRSGNAFTVRGTGGALAAAATAQPLFTLNVTAKTQYATRLANIALRNPTAQTTDGRTFTASVAAGGDIALRFTDSNDPPIVSFRSGAIGVVERERVEVPIVLITTDTIDLSTLRIVGTYDAAKLTLASIRDDGSVVATSSGNGVWSLSGQTGFLFPNSANALATLVFEARDVDADTTTFVGVESASAGSADGVAAIVRKPSPIVVTIHNNPAFDPVHATFLPGTASAKIGTEAALPVSVLIDAALDGATWSVSGTYDATLLDILGASALASGIAQPECVASNGAFTVRGKGGTLAAKTTAQPLFALRVRPIVQYETRTTGVMLDNVRASASDGRVFITSIGSGGGIAIHFSDTDNPPVISFPATAVEGYERREISVPVRVTTSDALDRGRFTIEGTWDTARLELLRVEAATGFGGEGAAATQRWGISGTAGVVPAGTVALGSLVFRAKDVIADMQTQVQVGGGTAFSTEGIAAAGIPAATFGVLVKNDPAFDPIHATFAIGSGTAEIGSVASVKVAATFDQPMNGATLVVKIRYDASLLTVENVTPHVNGFTLTRSASAGVLTVTGTAGTIPKPSAKLDLFTVSFRLAKQQTTHSTALSFASTPVAKSTDGRTYIIDAATGGSVAITWTEKPRYFKGDVNGDGVLNGDDIRYMAQLIKNKTKPTANEQKAWPLPQGSSVWTATSYQQLKKYFADLGISNR